MVVRARHIELGVNHADTEFHARTVLCNFMHDDMADHDEEQEEEEDGSARTRLA